MEIQHAYDTTAICHLRRSSFRCMSDAMPAASSVPQPQSDRLVSLDAYRGAIMLLMASSGFGIPQVAKQFPGNPLWQLLGRQCEHAEWAGCTLWDVIQPA